MSSLRGLAGILCTGLVALGGCGFDPHPKSGEVACKPQGTACCPEGYVCVGRGASVDGGRSAGTCWNKDDLPQSALGSMHEATPGIANDPACLVTDWLPPGSGTGGAGGKLDAAPADTSGPPPVKLDATGPEPGAEAQPIPDTAPDLPVVIADTADAVPDAPIAPDAPPAEAGRHDLSGDGGGTVDGNSIDGVIDAPGTDVLDAPIADAPAPLVDTSLDVATPDSPPPQDTGGEAGGEEAGLSRVITGIASGAQHACALVNGGVQCWGYGGTLGDGTTVGSPVPVRTVGLQSGVSAIAAGGGNTCAVTNGALKCWGGNGSGAIGDGTNTSRWVPVQVLGLDSGVTAVSLGMEHACAIVGGALKCWGANDNGELGDATTSARNTPVQVAGLTSGVTAVACGSHHTCAVANGETFCWGENASRQLGDGSSTPSSTPVHVVGLSASSGVTALAAGAAHTCAVIAGAVECWGSNGWGQLGDGTQATQSSCIAGHQILAGATAVVTQSFHTCAIAGGQARCWGDDTEGAVGSDPSGHASSSLQLTPAPVVGLGAGVSAITVGESHSCAVVGSQAWCWGKNNYGQLGDGTTTHPQGPVQVHLL